MLAPALSPRHVAILLLAAGACGGRVLPAQPGQAPGDGSIAAAPGDAALPAGGDGTGDGGAAGASAAPRVTSGFPVAATVAGAALSLGPYAVKQGQTIVLATFQDWSGAADFTVAQHGGALAWTRVRASAAPFTGTLAVYSAVAGADASDATTDVRSTVGASVLSAMVVALDGAGGVAGSAYAGGSAAPVEVPLTASDAGSLLLGFGAFGHAAPTAAAGATLLFGSTETLGWDVWAEAQPAAAAGPTTVGVTNDVRQDPWALIAVEIAPAAAAPDGDAGVAPVADGGVAPPAPTTPPANPTPKFGCWAWGAPDPQAIVHAGFDWFETGYPGTLPSSGTQLLGQGGVRPFSYINMSEVPNDDTYLQGQIGTFYSSIALCQNTSWNTTIVDVRDPRWQQWLESRAEYAYSLGNRGIKWDVAAVEGLCDGWANAGGAASAQQAVDAMAGVLAHLKQQHPDLRFIVNQGFALAQQHPELVDGLELENLINYRDGHPGDQWASDVIASAQKIHAAGTPILDLEYYDLFGCSDTTCAYATQLYDEIVALGWVPYITKVYMNVEGRGLGILPPW